MNIIKVNRTPDYKDIDLDFFRNPATGDVATKSGVDAITRSVRNLVLTNFYDRKFQSYIGSNAQKLLFENINPLTANFLKDAILEVIKNFEPRVDVLSIIVSVDPDYNRYAVKLTFKIVNRLEPVTTTLFLKRIR